jgi:hypothetical protein
MLPTLRAPQTVSTQAAAAPASHERTSLFAAGL